ncbi:MAG: hypothetical protein QNJ73_04545 [Gammaproteobacteria bacterium]|nr:hypothetical protein [Gammaproteobacteria bacterium]
MRRSVINLVVILLSLSLLPVAIASVAERERRSLHRPVPPRIIGVYTDAGQLLVAGENLPAGEDVEVRLGDNLLEVTLSSKTLLVARLPVGALGQVDELVIRRGVRRARIRGEAVQWGLRLPNLFR